MKLVLPHRVSDFQDPFTGVQYLLDSLIEEDVQ